MKKDKRTQSFFLAGKYPDLPDLQKLYGYVQQQNSTGAEVSLESALDGDIGVPKAKIKVLWALLKSAGIVTARQKKWSLKRAGVTDKELGSLMHEYLHKKDSDQEKLKQMIIYAQTALCRWKVLLEYFGQSVDWQRCDHCDNCLKETSRMVETTGSAVTASTAG